MAEIVNNKITVQFAGDVDSVTVDLSDDGDLVYLECGAEQILIPVKEVGDFISIVSTWVARHPRIGTPE